MKASMLEVLLQGKVSRVMASFASCAGFGFRPVMRAVALTVAVHLR
jgi:hypothetical protein